ncbi:MAG: 30S ribosomal protein S12 methylthiotransferase RimO [Firmicutes bacterium]|nr:30S ribosomal protein S12 methylthiotransferase RimO [Bacillota bacterium]
MSGIKVALISLGCAKNLVDSEVILAQLASENFKIVTNPAQADAIIINTCGFIETAKQESINKILELAQLKNDKCQVLLAAGCLAQRYGEELLLEIPELDGIFGTNDLHAAAAAIRRSLEGKRAIFLQGEYQASDYAARLLSTPEHTAYLKIAEGCDNHCSYCAIPAIRGPYRSRKMDAIIKEAQKLAAKGVKELNLVAQDITLYGIDRSGRLELPELLTELAAIDGFAWIRLLYAYPERLNQRIVKTMAQLDKVCNYLDLPLQHASDRILRRMGRKLSSKEILQLIAQLRQEIPNLTLRSSFIVGFPGETEADFQELLAFLRLAKLDRVGFFSYSREEGTAAARYPDQISPEVKKERLNRAISVQSEIITQKQKSLVGKTFMAMVDGRSAQNPKIMLLRTEMQAPEVDGYIRVSGLQAKSGAFLPVRITGFAGYDLIGELEGK